jgi:hypothetical protein
VRSACTDVVLPLWAIVVVSLDVALSLGLLTLHTLYFSFIGYLLAVLSHDLLMCLAYL